MTRTELIAALEAYDLPAKWTNKAITDRDALLFGCWWYGRSTEADKPNQHWPGPDYIASKRSSEPAYLVSVDAALSLVPRGHRYLLDAPPDAGGKADGYRAHVWCGAQPSYGQTATWARTPALALTIAALKAREYRYHDIKTETE